MMTIFLKSVTLIALLLIFSQLKGKASGNELAKSTTSEKPKCAQEFKESAMKIDVPNEKKWKIVPTIKRREIKYTKLKNFVILKKPLSPIFATKQKNSI